MIGIAGGYGDIGHRIAQLLRRTYSIRIGGRTVSQNLSKDYQFYCLDLDEPDTIPAFVDGCTAVINCVSCQGSQELAAEAARHGCHYIDLAKGNYLGSPGDCCILSEAGSIPGLSGILPLYLAERFEHVDDLESYYCALGTFTETAARDYLEGLFDEEKKTMVMCFNGQVIPYCPDERVVVLPLNNEYYRISPYLDWECLHTAEIIKPTTAKWFMAMAGDYSMKLLDQAHAAYRRDPQKMIKRLCMAAAADCGIRGTYSGFVIQIKGQIDGKNAIQTCVLKYSEPAALTALTAASATILMVNGKLADGICRLSEIEAGNLLISVMKALDNHFQLEVYPCGIADLIVVNEGEV